MWLKCAGRVENHSEYTSDIHTPVQQQWYFCSLATSSISSSCVYFCVCVCELSCLIYVWLFCDPMYYNPSGSSVHGIFPARILEWVVMPSSRGCSQLWDQTHFFCVSCTAGPFFTAEPLGKPRLFLGLSKPPSTETAQGAFKSMSIRHINTFAQMLSSASRCCWVWMKVLHDLLCWSVQLPLCPLHLLSRMFAQKSLAGLFLNIWASGRPSRPLNLNYSLSTGHLLLQHLVCVLQVTYHSLKLFIYLLS